MQESIVFYCVYNVVVKKFTFAISSPDEFLVLFERLGYYHSGGEIKIVVYNKMEKTSAS